MASNEAKTFVAIANNSWGKAKTIEEAKKNARLEGGRKGEKCWIMAISVEPKDVTVNSFIDCDVRWPKDAVAVKWQDKL